MPSIWASKIIVMSETVLVVKASKCYHTDPDCRELNQATKNIQEWEKEDAEAWDKSECKYCAGEWEATGGGMTLYD